MEWVGTRDAAYHPAVPGTTASQRRVRTHRSAVPRDDPVPEKGPDSQVGSAQDGPTGQQFPGVAPSLVFCLRVPLWFLPILHFVY